MAFKNDLSLSLFGKISLNKQWSEENDRNVSYTCVRCSRLFQAAVSSISRVQFTIERVYKRSRKTKLLDLSKIIHQNWSYQYLIKIPLLKLRKTRLSLKFLEQKEFVCRLETELSHSCTSFARRKHFKMAFDAWKNLQWKLVLNFIVAKSLRKLFLKSRCSLLTPKGWYRPFCCCFGRFPSAECLYLTSWFNSLLKLANLISWKSGKKLELKIS